MSAAPDRALALLGELDSALGDERAAVERLDRGGLATAQERKLSLVGELEALGALSPEEAPLPLRGRLKEAAAAVRAHAAANAALLADAAASITQALGLRTETGLYDRHARRLDTVRAVGGSSA